MSEPTARASQRLRRERTGAGNAAAYAWFRTAALAVGIVVLAMLPLNSTPYTNYQIALVATYAVAILGLNLVSGYAGQISLGQSAFFGLGAYCAAIATVRAGWPLPASFLLACALPAAVGLLVAIPAVRLRGHGLAIFTLALPLIGVALAKRFIGLTGGSEGLSARISRAPAWTGLDTDQWTYYVVLAIAGALFLLARNMVTGRLGRALSTIRENEVVAVSMGISPQKYKALAFAMAAAFGGAAGWLYVYTIGFVSPVEMEFLLSINLLAMMIVGGMGSVLGSLSGRRAVRLHSHCCRDGGPRPHHPALRRDPRVGALLRSGRYRSGAAPGRRLARRPAGRARPGPAGSERRRDRGAGSVSRDQDLDDGWRRRASAPRIQGRCIVRQRFMVRQRSCATATAQQLPRARRGDRGDRSAFLPAADAMRAGPRRLPGSPTPR